MERPARLAVCARAMSVRVALVLVVCAGMLGCEAGAGPAVDAAALDAAGAIDAATSPDAAPVDAAPRDDAGSPDLDAGSDFDATMWEPDAGTSDFDAATSDSDAATADFDAATADFDAAIAELDAGSAPDAGSASDAGPTCAFAAALQTATAGELARQATTPGVTLGIDMPGCAWVSSAGVADRTTARAMTPSDGLRVASITKTFTAAVVLQLIDEGALRFERAATRILRCRAEYGRASARSLLRGAAHRHGRHGRGARLPRTAIFTQSPPDQRQLDCRQQHPSLRATSRRRLRVHRRREERRDRVR